MDTVVLFLILAAIGLFVAYRVSSGGPVKFRIVYNAWWMFWARGMVLWPWVWFKPSNDQVPDTLYRHEFEHCYQIHRMGRVKFYLRYLALQAKHGYKNHPYEIEANERENDPLTETEKQWIANGKVEL